MAISHRSYGDRLLDCAPRPLPIANALRAILGIRAADCQLPGFTAKGACAGVDHMRCLVFGGPTVLDSIEIPRSHLRRLKHFQGDHARMIVSSCLDPRIWLRLPCSWTPDLTESTVAWILRSEGNLHFGPLPDSDLCAPIEGEVAALFDQDFGNDGQGYTASEEGNDDSLYELLRSMFHVKRKIILMTGTPGNHARCHIQE